MERLDKIISNNSKFSRSDVKILIKQKRIKVNEKIIVKSDYKINIEEDKIYIDNELIDIMDKIYLVLNKPKGYITATEDKNQQTILDLISEEYRIRNIFPVRKVRQRYYWINNTHK